MMTLALMFAAPVLARERGSERQVDFKAYDSYFEGNDSGLKGKTSYVVFTSQANFDKVFHPAATMGQNNFLPQHTFDTKLVVATIKRGNFLRTYELTKVTAKSGKLYVWYTVKDSADGSASFRSPLILAVDKDHYSQIVFMENGKRVRAIPLSNG